MGGHTGGEDGEEEKASEKVGDGSLDGERRSAGATPMSGAAGWVKRGSTAPGAGSRNSGTSGTGASSSTRRRARSASTVSTRRRSPKCLRAQAKATTKLGHQMGSGRRRRALTFSSTAAL